MSILKKMLRTCVLLSAMMEIVESKSDITEIAGFLSSITAYIIGSNVTLRNGETVGFSADQKIKITESKGKFLEGQTLKLAY